MSEYYECLIKNADALSTAPDDMNISIGAADMIGKTAKILHSIEGKGNFAADAEVCKKLSNKAAGLTTNATNAAFLDTYDKEKLAEHIRNNKGMWHFSFPYEVPVYSYWLLPYEDKPKLPQKRSYNRMNRTQPKTVKAPEKVARTRYDREESVLEVHNYLKKGACSYFHLILDPTSFTRTIENIYNVASLIKANKVALYIDPDKKLPFLKCVEKERNKQNSERKQFIQTLDMEQWTNFIEALHITEPLLNRQVEIDDNMDMSDENQS